MTSRLRVAIAGASGFVGRHLVDRLTANHEVFALGRSAVDGEPWQGTDAEGRTCDLFSLRDAEHALRGVDVAYYLVHSMMPTARLTQASFEDMDAILADNFGRAAARAGVKQIIYLGGLLPDTRRLSAHLRSRAEVERLLGAYGVPVTVLRAGLVVGPDGSSFRILRKLVERLPVLVCPSWTGSKTQPIALDDVVELLARCAGREDTFGETYDVGGADVLTYREMIGLTAELLGLRRKLVSVPVFTPGLSTLWVSLVTGTPQALVGPLVQSLRYPMVASDDRLARLLGVTPKGFAEAVRDAVEHETAVVVGKTRSGPPARRRSVPDVRSIQRLSGRSVENARQVARRYIGWLPLFCRPWLRVDVADGVCRFRFAGFRWSLLELTYSEERSDAARALLYITGGALAHVQDGHRSRLEFRLVNDGETVLAAIHDFRPALPWFVYRATQAQAHLVVMSAFGRYLRRSPKLLESSQG